MDSLTRAVYMANFRILCRFFLVQQIHAAANKTSESPSEYP
jgi:hypothetical protein